MSQSFDLDAVVHARFRDEFGPPHDSLHDGEHWAIRPLAGATTINILVNGTRDGPSVWVFDPYDRVNGVLNVTIQAPRQVDDVIEQIHARLTSVRRRPRRTIVQIHSDVRQAAAFAAAVQKQFDERRDRPREIEPDPQSHQ